MPVYEARFPNGVCSALNDIRGTAIKNLDQAKFLLFEPGKYELTPLQFLSPTWRYLLEVFTYSKHPFFPGMLYKIVAQEFTRIYGTKANWSQDSLSRPGLLGATYNLVHGGEIPHITQVTDNPNVVNILSAVLGVKDYLPAIAKGESQPYRNFLEDVLNILKAENDGITEEELITRVIRLDPYYHNRPMANFHTVLENFAIRRVISRQAKGNTHVLFLRAK